MSAPLTAELFARAIIASAVSFGDDPAEALTTTLRLRRRCLAPAVIGLVRATNVHLDRIAGILALKVSNITAAAERASPGFVRAAEAAREAVALHLGGLEPEAPAQAYAEPAVEPAQVAAESASEPEPAVVAMPVEPAPAFFEVTPEEVETAEGGRHEPAGQHPAIPPLRRGDMAPPLPAQKAAASPASRPAPSRPAAKAKPSRQGRAIPRGAVFQSLGDGVSVIRLKPITDSVLRHARQQAGCGVDVDELADLFGVDADQLRRRLNEGAAA